MKELVIPIRERLLLFLTENSIKPSHYLQLYLTTKRNGTPHPAEKEKAREFYNALTEYNLAIEYYSQRIGKNRLNLTFYAGTNRQNLQRLLNALDSPEKIQIGLALGYPNDAAELFDLNGERNRVFQHELKKAVQRRKTIPTWIAYLDHTPALFDLTNQRISPSSQSQAEKYMEFTRRTNEHLAEVLENRFHNVVLKKLQRK